MTNKASFCTYAALLQDWHNLRLKLIDIVMACRPGFSLLLGACAALIGRVRGVGDALHLHEEWPHGPPNPLLMGTSGSSVGGAFERRLVRGFFHRE